jgi:hypothetical protein
MALQLVVSNETPKSAVLVWKTVTLGVHKTFAAYRKAFAEQQQEEAGDWPAWLNIPCAQQETEVDLVLLSFADLGFAKSNLKKQYTYRSIYDKGVQMGFEFCPPEVACALHLTNGDLPIYNWIDIAMEGLPGPGGHRCIFALEGSPQGMQLWISTDSVYHYVGRHRSFVFVKPRKK